MHLLQNGTDELSRCFDIAYKRVHLVSTTEFCKNEEIQALRECLNNGINKMSKCFKGDDTFLGDFLKDSVQSMLDYICHDNARNLKGT